MTDSKRIELAIRRVSDRLKAAGSYNMDVTQALDMLADEIAGTTSQACLQPPQVEWFEDGGTVWVRHR